MATGLLAVFLLGGLAVQEGLAQQKPGRKKQGKAATGAANLAAVPAPTLTDVKYGPYARNVLDFWRAPSDRPTGFCARPELCGLWRMTGRTS